MKFILGFLVKLVLLILLVTLVVPIGYLAWRADQPMALPQFKGLTYYQYLNWRKDAYHQMAVNYKASHPNAKMGGGLDMCFQDETAVDLAYSLPVSGIYVLSSVFPNLQKFIDQSQIKAPSGVTWLNFLPDWWLVYEKFVLDDVETTHDDAVAFCRLQPNVPTPTQLQAMLAKEQASQQANP